ncbi:MAG TPA: copper resistance CopC family protein [Candidatus Limnocylindrales bacterium]|nr:copper resistance CopC family protein [Candidatus Limnocylindrales bacterium]
MIRRVAVTAALAAVLLGHAAQVDAHAELVASTPGAGERVAQSPAELRLVFSEPLDPHYSSLDVIGPTGGSLAAGIGRLDAADAHVLVAPLPSLADGVYTIVWRALSAADGHAEQGAFSFGVGPGEALGAAGPDAGGGVTGDAHAESHGGGGEIQATFLLDAGVLLSFGLMVIAWVVLEPLPAGVPSAVIVGAGIALLAAGAGAGLSILVAAGGVSADPVEYALRTRPGLLLLGRALAGFAGGIVVIVLTRLRRGGIGGEVAMFAAATVLALTALSGHAAAFTSPAPILADAVHVGAAGTWMAGLVVLASFATVRRGDAEALRAIVPRFSALALVSVALVALTGLYSAWIETGDFTAFDDPYVRTLAIKSALALAAFAVGAANLLSDPAGSRLGGLGRRVGVEAGLAFVVVVATAALTTGAPAVDGRAIPLAAAEPAPASGSAGDMPVSLAVAPGRPGPNRFVGSVGGSMPEGTTARLMLDRLDAPAAPIEQPLVRGDAGYAADVGGFPADSRWDAVLVVSSADGAELARRRFVFGIGTGGLTEGRATLPIDPAVTAAILLFALGLLATVFAFAGGCLPRVEPRTGRLALLVGGPLGAALGAAMLLVGPGV